MSEKRVASAASNEQHPSTVCVPRSHCSTAELLCNNVAAALFKCPCDRPSPTALQPWRRRVRLRAVSHPLASHYSQQQPIHLLHHHSHQPGLRQLHPLSTRPPLHHTHLPSVHALTYLPPLVGGASCRMQLPLPLPPQHRLRVQLFSRLKHQQVLPQPMYQQLTTLLPALPLHLHYLSVNQ